MTRFGTRPGFAVEHPGIILWEEFLQPLGITQTKAARDLDVSFPRLNELLNCKRSVTPDTAMRLSRYLGTSPEFWLNWQAVYDLQQVEKRYRKEYTAIRPLAA